MFIFFDFNNIDVTIAVKMVIELYNRPGLLRPIVKRPSSQEPLNREPLLNARKKHVDPGIPAHSNEVTDEIDRGESQLIERFTSVTK